MARPAKMGWQALREAEIRYAVEGPEGPRGRRRPSRLARQPYRLPLPAQVVTIVRRHQPKLWAIAPANMRIAPSAISARPGRFAPKLNPALGRVGSRVPPAAADDRDRLPLSRPRQMGWAAMDSRPPTNRSAPSQMTSMPVSPSDLSHSLPISRPSLFTVKRQQCDATPRPKGERRRLTWSSMPSAPSGLPRARSRGSGQRRGPRIQALRPRRSGAKEGSPRSLHP